MVLRRVASWDRGVPVSRSMGAEPEAIGRNVETERSAKGGQLETERLARHIEYSFLIGTLIARWAEPTVATSPRPGLVLSRLLGRSPLPRGECKRRAPKVKNGISLQPDHGHAHTNTLLVDTSFLGACVCVCVCVFVCVGACVCLCVCDVPCVGTTPLPCDTQRCLV